MSWKVMMKFPNQKPAGNALRFATWDEAYSYGLDLLMRWTMPSGYSVVETTDPVNYAWQSETGAVRLQQ